MKTVRTWMGWAVCLCAACGAARGEDAGMGMTNGVFLVSPLAGWNRNETSMTGHSGSTTVLKDSDSEYGLFAMYVSPRVIANNIAFLTSASGSDIVGDIAYVNVYGDPEAVCTWNLGGGYIWHEVESSRSEITISEPIARAGALFRWRAMNVSLNPYVAYAWLGMDTNGSRQEEESVLCGLAAEWHWRMLRVSGKYYREYNREREEWFDVARLWAVVMFNRSLGVLARAEYMEEINSKNTSLLLGPVFAF